MSAGARGDRRKQQTGSRVGAAGEELGWARRRVRWPRAVISSSAPGPPFGGGVCESQGLGGRRGQRGAVDAQIPLGLA